ncbi:MAG: phage holin family protein [Methanomicrobiales archaeon]|nr:phage holin family protein [Methanomicrobiales archaeon]
MEPDARDDPPTIESEFATTVKYLDLYVRQKTDLFIQNYVFEPFDMLGTKLMFLAIVLTLLATGTLIFVAGIILFIATLVPLWAALLISAVGAFLVAAILARVFFYKKIVLNTPTAREMMNRERP